MRSALTPLLFLTLMCNVAAASAEQGSEFPGIQKLMSEEEYQAAGLDKLSADERAALNRWLVNYTAAEAPALLRTNPEVIAAEYLSQARHAGVRVPQLVPDPSVQVIQCSLITGDVLL